MVTELENELVFALLVDKKHSGEANSENALALIGKIKAVLQPSSVTKKEAEINAPATGKSVAFFSH